MILLYEIFGDTKRVIRSRKSKKDTQYNGQKKNDKRINIDLQQTTQKTEYGAKRIPLNTGGGLMYLGRVVGSCSSSAFRRVTAKRHEHHLIWK